MVKKSEYSDIKESERVATVFSESTAFNGVLQFETSLKIEGYFKGRILSSGHLIIGERAKVYANIKVNSIVVAGEVKGDVEARDRLEILSSGKLFGNIKTKKLKMANGVIFEGSCTMLQQGEGETEQEIGSPGLPLPPILEEENEQVIQTN